jgi:cardiolipin synthase A/B
VEWAIVWAVIATLTVVFLVLNLSAGEKQINEQPEHLYATDDSQFKRVLGALLGPPVLDGNSVQALQNGNAIFPAMLDAIRSAERTITFETYIYWSGSIGAEFADALSERAQAGVKVHVLLDWVGSAKMEAKYLEQLQRCGARVERYHKPHWSRLSRLNNRTHRKVLVIDGRIGFTGGVGIADHWRGNAQDPDHWRDVHYRVEGPVVAQMQAVFSDNWIKSTGCVLHGEPYFPALTCTGTLLAQMFSSSLTGGGESMHLMYLLTITAAQRSIHLASAYFVPDELAIQALCAAATRGAAVRIIVPGEHIDTAVVRRASRAKWGRLLACGIEIAEYQPTMFHCKVLIVDELLVSVGSTNFDNRSFRLNDEANLNVFDPVFAAEQVEAFEADWRSGKRITLTAWQRRPLWEKVTERAAVLLGTQL